MLSWASPNLETITFEEAKEVFLNRGFDNRGVYYGDAWRVAVAKLSQMLDNGELIYNPFLKK